MIIGKEVRNEEEKRQAGKEVRRENEKGKVERKTT